MIWAKEFLTMCEESASIQSPIRASPNRFGERVKNVPVRVWRQLSTSPDDSLIYERQEHDLRRPIYWYIGRPVYQKFEPVGLTAT